MKMGYEEDFLRFLQQCWQDVERRIRRNHQRLQLTEERNQQVFIPRQMFHSISYPNNHFLLQALLVCLNRKFSKLQLHFSTKLSSSVVVFPLSRFLSANHVF